jgi:hypothetical protein
MVRKKEGAKKREMRCTLAEGLSPVILGKGAALSMSAAKG